MPLTPADIHNMVFKKSSLGRRGYDEEDVDSLLDAVTQEMIKLLEENEVLRNQAQRVQRVEAPVSDGSAEAELSAVSDRLNQARRACDQAERNARMLRSGLDSARLDHARRAAPVEPAAPSADTGRVLTLAHRTAEQHLDSAHEQAHDLLREARDQSDRIAETARRAAHDLAEDSQRRHNGAVAETQDRRTALQREIGELTEFAGNYRAALESHIRRQSEL